MMNQTNEADDRGDLQAWPENGADLLAWDRIEQIFGLELIMKQIFTGI